MPSFGASIGGFITEDQDREEILRRAKEMMEPEESGNSELDKSLEYLRKEQWDYAHDTGKYDPENQPKGFTERSRGFLNALGLGPGYEKSVDGFDRMGLDELPAETPQMAAERDVARAQRSGRNLRFEPGQQIPFKAKKMPAPTVGDYFRFLWEGISTGMGLF